MTPRERIPFALLIGLVSIGLLASCYAIWVQQGRVADNQAALRQQQRTVDALLAQSAEDRQALSDMQRLVRALQEQVRSLGGEPLTQAPMPAAGQAPAGQASPAGTPPTPRPRATPTRAPRPTPTPPQATPRPTVSPTPDPLPSPICLFGVVCLP